MGTDTDINNAVRFAAQYLRTSDRLARRAVLLAPTARGFIDPNLPPSVLLFGLILGVGTCLFIDKVGIPLDALAMHRAAQALAGPDIGWQWLLSC